MNHHPLNTLLIQASVALFGNSVSAIRYPAFLFGVGCIPASYALARAVGGPGVAVLTASLVAAASAMVEYSVNARGYSAVTFFTLLMLWAGQRAVRSRSSLTWALVVLAAAGGIYANIVMILPGIASFVWFGWLALTRPATDRLKAMQDMVVCGLAVVLATILLYLPFFTVSGWDAVANSQGIKAQSTAGGALATLPGFVVRLMENWGRDVWLPLGWTALALAIGAPLLARRQRLASTGLLLGIAAAIAFQFVIVRDAGPYRVWLPFLPILLLLTAAATNGIIGRLGEPAPRILALVLLAGMTTAVARTGTLVTSIETAYFPGARTVAERVLDMTANDVLATMTFRGDEIVYYALRRGLILETLQTKEPLRFYHPRSAPLASGPGQLTVIVDKATTVCLQVDCPAVARATIPTEGPLQTIFDTTDWAELRSTRR